MISINHEKQDRRRFYILLASLLGLCFIRYALQVNIPQIILLAIAVIIIFLGDGDEIIAMCICCIPLYTSFPFIYVILLGILVFAAKCSSGIRVNKSIIPIFLIVIWEVLHCFGKDFLITQFVGMCLPFLLLMLLMCSGNVRLDYGFIVRAFVFAIAGTCMTLLGKLFYLADFNLMDVFLNLRRLGLVSEEAKTSLLITGGELNPNTLGVQCVLGMTGLFQLRAAGKSSRTDTPMVVFMLIFGIMTASKTFFACLLLMALMLFLGKKGSLSRKIRFLAGVLIAAAVAVLLLNIIAPGLLAFYIGRFDVKDITTGRIKLMQVYHEFIMNEKGVFIFGIGLHDFAIKLLDIYQVNYGVPHNSIQELIIAWGIPGFGLFAGMCVEMIHRSKRHGWKRGLINYIPLAVILFKGLAGQMLTVVHTMLAFSFTYISLCTDFSRPEEVGMEQPMSFATVDGVSFKRAVNTLLRRAWIIALVSVACAVAAFGITKRYVTPMYKSSAMFYVNNNSVNLNDVAESITTGDITAARRLVNSYIVILNARDTLDKVIEYAGLDMEYEELKEMIHTLQVDETEIFRVTITSDDPKEAEQIANAIAAVFPDRISEIIQGTAAKVVDYAVVPSRPSSPSGSTNAMLGFILGFVAITLLILLRDIKDNRIRAVEDFSEVIGYPVLAAVPDLNKGGKHPEGYGGA